MKLIFKKQKYVDLPLLIHAYDFENSLQYKQTDCRGWGSGGGLNCLFLPFPVIIADISGSWNDIFFIFKIKLHIIVCSRKNKRDFDLKSKSNDEIRNKGLLEV